MKHTAKQLINIVFYATLFLLKRMLPSLRQLAFGDKMNTWSKSCSEAQLKKKEVENADNRLNY